MKRLILWVLAVHGFGFPFYVYAVLVVWQLELERFSWSLCCLIIAVLKFSTGKAVLQLLAKMENIKKGSLPT